MNSAISYRSTSPRVVLLHGGPSLFGYMRSLGDLLGSDFEVLDYAQRGTFENPAPIESITLDRLTEDLNGVVSSGGRTAVILGHSWGAILALLFAARYPASVDKLILLGTGVMDRSIGDHFSNALRAKLGPRERKEVDRIESACAKSRSMAERQSLMQRWLDLHTPFYNLDPGSTKSLASSRWNYETFEVLNSQIWALIEGGKIPEILERVKAPVVAFHGSHDPIPCALTEQFLSQYLSKMHFERVERAGHFIWVEPDAKRSFLSKLKAAIRS